MTLQEVEKHWRYFESIDEELLDTCKYVEHDFENLNVYSNAFARIILAANSEVDVVCRLFSHEIDPSTRYADDAIRNGNIREYANVILGKYPRLIETTVESTTLRVDLTPWSDWRITPDYKSPDWWGDYQKVKHYRHSNFHLASLKNAIDSVAGLYILLLYMNKHVTGHSGSLEAGGSDCFFSRARLDFDDSTMGDRYKVEQLPDF